jgi:hypothetical protein
MFFIILDWLKEWQFWMALTSLVGGIFAVHKYLDSKKQQEFENYHRLIEKLNNLDGKTPRQSQMAAIFELRYYHRYKSLTIKLLDFWKKDERHLELIEITNDTLKFLK